MSDPFVMSVGMKLPELQQASTLQPAVTKAVSDRVTDAELNAFTRGLDSLAESHMASTHSRSNRPSVGIRSQAHHVADVLQHGREKSPSDLAAGSLLASAVVSHTHEAHCLFCICSVVSFLSPCRSCNRSIMRVTCHISSMTAFNI